MSYSTQTWPVSRHYLLTFTILCVVYFLSLFFPTKIIYTRRHCLLVPSLFWMGWDGTKKRLPCSQQITQQQQDPTHKLSSLSHTRSSLYSASLNHLPTPQSSYTHTHTYTHICALEKPRFTHIGSYGWAPSCIEWASTHLEKKRHKTPQNRAGTWIKAVGGNTGIGRGISWVSRHIIVRDNKLCIEMGYRLLGDIHFYCDKSHFLLYKKKKKKV